MREFRSSGSVEGVMGNHDPYSDYSLLHPHWYLMGRGEKNRLVVPENIIKCSFRHASYFFRLANRPRSPIVLAQDTAAVP